MYYSQPFNRFKLFSVSKLCSTYNRLKLDFPIEFQNLCLKIGYQSEQCFEYLYISFIHEMKGCGASCIYPLLGTKLNNWNFIASEPDGLSYRFAQKNIEINKLNSKIILTEGNSDTLLKDAVEGNNQYDFCMCNPPFFSDREEALGFKSRTDKRMLPHSVCTATDGETITEGGEVAFVKRIISESTELRHSVRYTILLIHCIRKNVY